MYNVICKLYDCNKQYIESVFILSHTHPYRYKMNRNLNNNIKTFWNCKTQNVFSTCCVLCVTHTSNIMEMLLQPTFCKRWSVVYDHTARKKATYDKFGEEGLKGGIPPETARSGAWSSGYTYHENPEKTFRQFFGGDNPFAGKTELQNTRPVQTWFLLPFWVFCEYC